MADNESCATCIHRGICGILWEFGDLLSTIHIIYADKERVLVEANWHKTLAEDCKYYEND